MIHRPAGAAGFVGFGHQRSQGHSADDAVATGKVGSFGAHAQGELADQGAAFVQDAPRQVGVLAGIDGIQAVAQHGDGAPAGVQRRLVRAGVYAQGQAADYGDAAGGEGGGEIGGGAVAITGRPPGADDRHGGFIGGQQCSPYVKDRRRIGGFPEAGRIAVVMPGERVQAGVGQPLPLLLGVDAVAGVHDGLGHSAPDAGRAQFAPGGVPGPRQVPPEVGLQHTETRGAQARHLAQRQPIGQCIAIVNGSSHEGQSIIALISPTTGNAILSAMGAKG